MVAPAVATNNATLLVKTPVTELIGISGRAIGVLEREARVLVHGELGPYTVVTYEGRNGYVLTDHLCDSKGLEEEALSDQAVEEEPPQGRHWARLLLAVLIPLAAAGSAAGALFGLA